MIDLLKQSTAVTVKLGPFVDDADGKTAETGLSIAQADIRLSKNGGAFAQTNNSAGATHDEGGYFGIPLNTTDTGTLGRLRVAVSKSGALPVWQDFLVVPAVVYDAIVAGTDNLQVDLAAVLNTTLTETSAGYLAAAFKKLFDVAAPVLTAASVNQTGDAYSRIGSNGAGLTSIGDTRMANLDAAISSRMASFTLPTNFSSLGINASGHVLRVVVVDTTTANSDMRGTDNALLASGYTAPANSDITAIKAKTDLLPNDPADASDINDAFVALGSAIASLGTPSQAGDAMTLTSGERNAIATAIFDLTNAIETGLTLRQAQRLQTAAAAGKLAGAATTTVEIRNVGDTKTRITATVDADGNRTAVTTDAT
jgi:hypothetical protein